MKAYSYIRFSSPEQAKGDSLRRQKDLSEKYCVENDLDLVQNYQDLGISAFKGRNVEQEQALGQFLQAVDKGIVSTGSYLLIESLDRLSRDKVLTAFSLFTSILSKGIVIVTLQDKKVYTLDSVNENIGSLFTSLGEMVRANSESETKSNRIKDSWNQRRDKAAERTVTTIAPAWLTALPDRSGFAVRHEVVQTIQQIIEMALQGMGAYAITARLNREEIVSPGKGPIWRLAYVKKLLTDHRLIGTYRPYRVENNKRVACDIEIENYYPVVIDKDKFWRLQQLLQLRKHGDNKGRKGLEFNNVFQGLLKCSSCGNTIAFYNKGSKGNFDRKYLTCKSKRFGSPCKTESIDYHWFERIFFQWMQEFDINSITTPDTRKELDELTGLRQQLQLLTCKRQELLQIVDSGNDLHLDILQRLSQQLRACDDDINAVHANIQALTAQTLLASPAQIESTVANIQALQELQGLSVGQRYLRRQALNQELKQLIERITVKTSILLEFEPFNPLQIMVMIKFKTGKVITLWFDREGKGFKYVKEMSA